MMLWPDDDDDDDARRRVDPGDRPLTLYFIGLGIAIVILFAVIWTR